MTTGVAPDVLTVEEVAEWLRVAPRTVRFYAQVGRLRAVKIGKLWRFKRQEIERVRERGVNGQAR